MDGDAKINFKEFELGMKSTLTIFGQPKKKQRPKSSNNPSQRLTNTASKASLMRNHSRNISQTPRKPSTATPRVKSANQRSRQKLISSKSQGKRRLNQVAPGRTKGFKTQDPYNMNGGDTSPYDEGLNKSVSFSQ